MKWHLLSGCLLMAFTAGIYSQPEDLVFTEVAANLAADEQLFRHFHQNPELSKEEFRTSERLSAELEREGFEVSRNIGGTGFVGVLENGEGPVILLRADMDALPIEENTGLPYASRTPGAMHACGHDIHMTVWLGTAKVLSALKDSWQGTLLMVAQPAEETGEGASAMLRDGLFTKFPVPDYALAYHVSPELPAGTIGYRPGAFMAGVNSVDITVYGRGGHGAMPHLAIDPVVLASRMVLAFQTIPSREISPLKPAVVTVGSIHGGSARNIIPDRVQMQLTVRFYEDEVQREILESLGRISSGIASSAGLPEELFPEVVLLDHRIPPLLNDEDLTRMAVRSFGLALGEQNVLPVEASTGAEDFALYGRTGEEVPIAMFWLGTVNPAKFENSGREDIPLPGLHNPQYVPDFEPTYKAGVLGMSRTVLDLLGR